MATRGRRIGLGILPGFGRVEVYADLDNTRMLHVLTKGDEWRYVHRGAITFIKSKGKRNG